MNGGNLEIILCLSRCMRSEEKAVSCVWFIKVSILRVGKVVSSMLECCAHRSSSGNH